MQTTSDYWSTNGFPAQQRLDYWVGVICEAFLEMDCDSTDKSNFAGQLESVHTESLVFNQVRASTQDVYRTPRAIAKSTQTPFYLITQLHDAWHVNINGASRSLRAGDVALVDATQPYELHFSKQVDCLSIQLPRAWVMRWLEQPNQKAPRMALHDQGWGRALSAFMMQLGSDLKSISAIPPALISDHLGALFAASFEPALLHNALEQAPTPTLKIYQHLCDLMKARLHERGLQAIDLATQAGISLRSLHRAFAGQGETFAKKLLLLRLTQAEQMLQSAHLRNISIAEIGRRCGFADASHFARCYQKNNHHTPKIMRQLIDK